ncbi:interleukin-10 receptor subunit alpha [Rhea pennata]|uniref:interleukin-10 receptor subunit alpha n=1 Tax=Rhea pennata TaxID=8795 RepID=UPI002E26C1D4
MAPGAAAPALCLALLLVRQILGEGLPSPQRVHFAAETAHHLLRWEPGPGSPADVRYDVQHRAYGTNLSWAAVPSCTSIPGLSCDLTYYTLDPERRYYAQVRAVSGNRTSPWRRTSSFSPKDASLRLAGQSLAVTGNTIRVKLQLLLRAGNRTVKYEDVQKHVRRYRAYVRRARDNHTHEVLETESEFNISNLFWGTEYCVSVEPEVATRQARTARTPEQCVTVGTRSELLPSVVGICFVALLPLVLLGALLVCMYLKKPVRPPSVLKSFMKQGSLWVEQEHFSSARPDADPIQLLFLCQKAPQQPGGPAGSTGALQQPPARDRALAALPEDGARPVGPGAARSGDCSGTSTDSGICLRVPSCELGPAGRGAAGPLPATEDSGISLERTSPRLGCAGRRPAGEVQPPPAEHGSPAAAGEDSPRDVEFRGYLQQSKGTVEQSGHRDEGPARGPGSTDAALDLDPSELPVAKGYLKQASPEAARGRAQDVPAPGCPWEPAAWGFPSQLGHGAPGTLGIADLLKPPLELGGPAGAAPGPLPLLSSLCTTAWLPPQGKPTPEAEG